MESNPACGGCSGPHPYDTSIPSVVWNEVIRARGLSEYLCLTCIVREFAMAKTSFTATLYGNGLDFTNIEVRIGGAVADDAHKVQEENNTLRWKLHEHADKVAEQAQRIKKLGQQVLDEVKVANAMTDKLSEANRQLAEANQRAEQAVAGSAEEDRDTAHVWAGRFDEGGADPDLFAAWLSRRISAAKLEGAQAERERCAKAVCDGCRSEWPLTNYAGRTRHQPTGKPWAWSKCYARELGILSPAEPKEI